MIGPKTEFPSGLLPALPPLETLVEWAMLSTLCVGLLGVACLLFGWWVLKNKSEDISMLIAAQSANRIALGGWFLGLLVAVAAPPFLIMVIPGILLHLMALSRLERCRYREERPVYPRLRLVHSAPQPVEDARKTLP